MTFASLLPLVLLVGVPIIIILYLMKPKGTRKVVPSVLLWKNAERNEKSTTFSKKLIKNILMFLEILALLFLIFSAMSPAIKRGMSGSAKSTIILIDVSGSMQFEDEGGKTRLEQAIADAKDLVDTSSGEITIVTSGRNIEVLANGSKDKQKLKRILSDIEPTDTAGDITRAEGILESLDKENIFVFTDGNGAAGLENMAAQFSMDINVYGSASNNAGITQMSMKKNSEGKYDIAVGYQTRGAGETQFDISLYDAEGNLLEVRSISEVGNTNNTILSMNKDVKGEYVRAELSGFDDDALSRDDVAYAVKNDASDMPGYLVGVGNTYFEKAYQAAKGETVVKVSSDSDIKDEKAVVIYDQASLVSENKNRLVQDMESGTGEQISGAIVTVRTGELINDMSDYTFGASNLNVLECPEWAEPLMVVSDDKEEKVVAYYGEQDGIRQVVLGFDIRDSEYPLMAEFPIFVADSLTYLSDESLVQSKYIEAGELVDLSPSVSESAKIQVEGSEKNSKSIADTNISTANLCKLTGDGIKDEYFVVRYPVSEGDGSIETESMSYISETGYGVRFGSIKRICLIIALLIIILDWIIYFRRRVKVPRLELVWRCILTFLVLLAIIGINLPGRKHKVVTIYAVDMSDSNISNLEDMEKYLSSKVEALPHGESYGIVTFGRNATTDQFINSEKNFMGIATDPDGSATDIEEAVDYSISLIPDNRLGRIVILTDGKETVGDINACRDKLEDNDIELCATLFDGEYGKDVYIQNIDMPEKIAGGDAYDIKATVYSTYETSAVLKLWDGSEVIDEMNVKLTKGENTFILTEVAGEDQIEKRKLTVEAEGDTVEQNNFMVAAAIVEAPKKTLLISGLNEDSAGLEKLLESVNKDVTVVSAVNAPEDITGVLNYQTIILDNCYIGDLPESFPAVLETYVKDYGGGVICTGGKESYAPGGYRDTVIEDLLPVDMTPKGLDEAPSLALVMVIDCSGSMDSAGFDPNTGQSVGRSKLDVAIDAAMEAVDSLNKTDYVGVLAFSDDYEWRQTIVQAEDKDKIKENIEGLGIMGGTVIKPAVKEATKKIAKQDVGIKHIILLTDGEGETKDFSDAIDEINDNNITMSTIAVGTDSDQTLLENLAEECNGRYYYSDSSSDVPKIFAEEVYLSGETYFKDGDFSLSVSANNELVENLYSKGIPNISGYVATSTKNGAREVITTSEDDPLLSCWQYGLGHSVAWMTNASGTWNEALVAEQDYAQMWKRMLDYASMESDIGQDSVSIYKRRGKVEIDYIASDYSENTSVTGIYTSPSGVTEELSLEPGEPGTYYASFEPSEMGVYSINVRRSEGDTVVASTTAIETLQFSDEYRRDISNANFVSFVESFGKVLETDANVYTKLKSSNKNKRDITDIIIVISIFMLLIDIVIRRFDMSRVFASFWVKKKERKETEGKKEKKNGKTQKTDKKEENDGDNGSVINDLQNTSSMIQSAWTEPPKSEQKEAAKSDQPAAPSGPAGLDTKALLKKKRDRNMN